MNATAEDFSENPSLYQIELKLGLSTDFTKWNEEDLIQYYYGEELQNDAEIYGIGGTKKEREKQLTRLSSLYQLKYLSASSINDEDFSVITQYSEIKKLYIDQPRVKTFDGLEKMTNLTHLHLGSARHVSSLRPLRALKNLKALSIVGSYQQLGHLRDIAESPALECLTICANDFQTLRFPSLSEIMPQRTLRLLSLAGVRFEDKMLSHLAKIKTLEYIALHEPDLKWYPLEEYRYLHQSLGKLKNKHFTLPRNLSIKKNGEFEPYSCGSSHRANAKCCSLI